MIFIMVLTRENNITMLLTLMIRFNNGEEEGETDGDDNIGGDNNSSGVRDGDDGDDDNYDGHGEDGSGSIVDDDDGDGDVDSDTDSDFSKLPPLIAYLNSCFNQVLHYSANWVHYKSVK